jgi:hypothetical protein
MSLGGVDDDVFLWCLVVEPRAEREVSGTPSEVERFKISEENAAHVMGVLRDAIYSDKVLAVLREYGANAQDSHRDPAAPPGARERPIEVRLPTLADPTLSISDFGPGLSHEAVMRLFTQYGSSTKRTQADATGFIGIGCKSAFAYSDSFAVVSRCGGRVRTYAAVLDPSDRGEMHLVDDRPAEDPNDTGLTVRVPVKTGDVAEFRAKAPGVFRYYDPQPIVWLGAERLALPDGRVGHVSRESGWTAVMGCVVYPVDPGQLKLPAWVAGAGGVVRFPLGALSVSASREALRYDARTKAELELGLCELVDDHARAIVAGAAGLDDWSLRLRLAGQRLFAPLLKAVSFDGAFSESVALPKRTKESMVRLSRDSLPVQPGAKIVFHDDPRAIGGFDLVSPCVVAKRAPSADDAGAWEDLQAMIAELRLSGLPVVRTSSLPWTRPQPLGRASGKRHRGRVFRLLPGEPQKGAVPSERWERVDADPQPGDLFVPLDSFRPPPWFWGRLASVTRALGAFGLQHPPVYGYRVLATDGDGGPKLPGTDYAEWLKTVYALARVSRPDLDELYEVSRYGAMQCDFRSSETTEKMLGADHPVAVLARRAEAARRARRLSTSQEHLITYAGTLARLAGKDCDPDYSCLARYPLLRQRAHDFLSSYNLDEWMEYVLALDAAHGAGYQRGAWKDRGKAPAPAGGGPRKRRGRGTSGSNGKDVAPGAAGGAE